jgi:hypothetical protein
MPAVNPRVQVSLSKASYRTLTHLAKRHSRSMSSIAAEVLNDVLPALEATLSLASDLRKKSPSEIAALKKTLEAWETLGKQQVAEHQRRFDSLKTDPGSKDKPAPSGGPRPPGTNRGV